MFCCRIDPPYISLLLLKNRGRSVSHRLFIWQCQVRVTEKKEVRQRHLQSESPFFPALTSHDKSPATMKILVTNLHTMWPYFSIKALLIVVVTSNTAAATAQSDTDANGGDIYPPLWGFAPENLLDFPVKDNKIVINPWNYQERLGVYKSLLKASAKYFMDFGSQNSGNILWGLPLQHGWQFRTGMNYVLQLLEQMVTRPALSHFFTRLLPCKTTTDSDCKFWHAMLNCQFEREILNEENILLSWEITIWLSIRKIYY